MATAAAQPAVGQRGTQAEAVFRPRQDKAMTENAPGEIQPAARGMPPKQMQPDSVQEADQIMWPL
nr:hypothetical protein RSP597_21295 [Ralstonia solanacearum]